MSTSSEARNLERISQAIDHHNATCEYPAVAVEMEEVRGRAEEAGDRRLQARALTALAHVALYHKADAVRGAELADAALELVADESDPDVHFEALHARWHVASSSADAIVMR